MGRLHTSHVLCEIKASKNSPVRIQHREYILLFSSIAYAHRHVGCRATADSNSNEGKIRLLMQRDPKYTYIFGCRAQ